MNQDTLASFSFQKFSSFIEQRFYLMLSLILFAGLLLRVLSFLDLKNSIYFDFMLWDERLYHEWAKDIADGTFQSSMVYEFAPVPAYFMALIYWAFSPDIVTIRYANIVLGVATCLLIYLIGYRMGGRTVGLGAALIACLYEPFIFYSIVPLKTGLSLFLFAATIYFLLAVFDSKSILNALFLGMAVGLVTNVRPNAVVWVPFLALAIVMVRYQGKASIRPVGNLLVLYVAGLTLAMAPFAIRNYMVAGDPRPTPSQSGFHIYLSNQIDTPDGVQFATTVPQERGIQFTIEASRRAGRTMSPGEASGYWAREALHSMKAQPWEHTKLLLKKVLLFFHWFERGDHYDIGFISEFVPIFRLPFIPFWIVLPFGMAGMALTAVGSRKLAVLMLMFCIYAATLVLFFTSTRLRLPTLVILIPFAVLGAQIFFAALSEKHFRKVVGYMVILLLVAVVEFLPLWNSKDMTTFLNTHAIMLSSQGKTGEAIPYWEASSKMEGRYSAFANLALTDVHLINRDFYKASEFLDRIPDDSFAAALKHEKLGDFFVLRRKEKEAIRAYRKALSYNQGLRRPRVKLIKLHVSVDPVAARAEFEKLQYISGFYDLFGDRQKLEKRRNK